MSKAPKAPKEKFPGLPGPWDAEPDELWHTTEVGYVGLALRHKRAYMGNWCGYVFIPKGHALWGVSCSAIEQDIDVHGGLTFSGKSHAPIGGLRTRGHWAFGFDCAHVYDLVPGMVVHYMTNHSEVFSLESVKNNVYRDLPFVVREIEKLAKQLKEREAVITKRRVRV